MRPGDQDKEQLSGQVGDLPLPSFGNRPPTGTLWPGGEISLVELIKLHVLPTDQQSLRIMLPEREGFPHNAGGERFKGGSLKGSSRCWFGDCSLERKAYQLKFAAVVPVQQCVLFSQKSHCSVC